MDQLITAVAALSNNLLDRSVQAYETLPGIAYKVLFCLLTHAQVDKQEPLYQFFHGLGLREVAEKTKLSINTVNKALAELIPEFVHDRVFQIRCFICDQRTSEFVPAREPVIGWVALCSVCGVK